MDLHKTKKRRNMIPNEQKIKSIKENLFYRSQDAISDYEKFDWHNHRGNIDTDKFNSSQAIAIDFWGCLELSPLKVRIINRIFNKSCDEWDIKFEFSDRDLMSEIRPTQIDVKIESDTCAIIIESKFAENNSGRCSQLKKTKKNLIQCNGRYEDQINPVNNIKSKCALKGKGIRYWDYISSTTTFDIHESQNPCPFRNREFQWIRNICFAEAYAMKFKKITECYLVYYKSDKCPISKKIYNNNYLGSLNGNLQNQQNFKQISYNDLLSEIITSILSKDSNEREIWVELQNWLTGKEKQI